MDSLLLSLIVVAVILLLLVLAVVAFGGRSPSRDGQPKREDDL